MVLPYIPSFRKAMRIALPGGDNGLNDDGTARAMSTIRQAVMQFRRRIEEDPKLTVDPLSHKVAKQIENIVTNSSQILSKWTPQLDQSPYILNAPNILEQFFVTYVVLTAGKPGTIPCIGNSKPC